MTIFAARALIVDEKGASWWEGVVDTEGGEFGYYTFKENRRVFRVLLRDQYSRVEILER